MAQMDGARAAASWVLALALGALLLWVADGLLFPAAPEANVLFPTIADRSGMALWEPTGRFAVALAHVLAAILLVIPFTRLLGAFLALAVSGGAVATHFLWLRQEVASGASGADLGMLLYIAVAAAVMSLLIAAVHPKEKTPY
jgi:hypothetical protein